MTKYELSLTKEYVPGWTLTDAMRELFQNAIDQETTNPDNAMFWEYHEEEESFHIGNKLSVLEPKSLLLGASSKTDDPDTIGKFGEGYKVATLVLLRLGKKVTFFNYGAREVWRTRFSKSRKYDAEILVFETDKQFPWKAVPNNNLTIVVEGISLEESLEIGSTNLHMQADINHWTTSKGKILRDEDLSGHMFVNGLYITTNKDFKYGYDFKPDAIELDRDRKLIKDFNLKWTTSQMWAAFQDDNDGWDYDAIDAAGTLVKESRPDVAFFRSANQWNTSSNKFVAIAQHAHEDFKHDHGENAVPVTSTAELNKVPSTHKPIIVSESYAEVIKASPEYAQPELINTPTLQERVSAGIDAWLIMYGADLSEYAVEALKGIADIVVNEEDKELPY